MNKKTIYLIVSIFILLVLVVAGSFVWLQKIKKPNLANNQEASLPQMEKYINTKYGYSFEYPNGTKIVKEDSSKEDSPLYIYDQSSENDRIEITIVSEKWLEEYFENLDREMGMEVKTYMVGKREVIDAKNFNKEWYRFLVSSREGLPYIILARQNKQTDFLDNIFNTLTISDEGASAGQIPEETVLKEIKKDFSYPYPVVWEEDGIEFSLQGISLGETLAPADTLNSSGGTYSENEKINALTLTLKIKNTTTTGGCVLLKLRRVINEEGDVVEPNTRQFNFNRTGGCGLSGGVSETQKVLFVVPKEDRSFDIATYYGPTSKVLFTVKLLYVDGLSIQPTLQLEKNTDEEGLRRIFPYNANVFTCSDAGGKTYQTTGLASDSQTWFVYGNCPTSKDYKVIAGKEMILDVTTDRRDCTSCVCNYPVFSLYEYRGNSWVKTKDFDLSNSLGNRVAEKIYYTPNTDRIKITTNKCFYLNVYQEGEDTSRIILNSLNKESTLHVGEKHNILWNSLNIDGNINIELVNKEAIEGSQGSTSWEINFNRVSAKNGIYEWKIDGLPSSNQDTLYKIHIFSNNNPYIEDYSDEYFKIIE